MANESFYVGATAKIAAEFTDEDDAAIDPTAVFCKIREPDGTITTYEYNTDPEVVKVSTGNYYLLQDCDATGWWVWRWYSTGTGKAATEGRFHVKESEFD